MLVKEIPSVAMIGMTRMMMNKDIKGMKTVRMNNTWLLFIEPGLPSHSSL
ncbi:MAG: hypothetical protein ACE5K3_05275 [bacterium]